MRRWKPYPSPGRWLALVLAVVFTGGCIAFAMLAHRHFSGVPAEWTVNLDFYLQFLAMLAMLICAGSTWMRFIQSQTLWYGLDRNAVYISSLGNRELVPLDQIRRLDFGIQVDKLPRSLFQGIGCYWGDTTSNDQTSVFVRSTLPISRCLFILTARGTYAISPSEIEAFVQDLEQRSNLGATKRLIPETEYGPWFNTPFWNDYSSTLLLGLAIIINVLAVGLLAWYYPTLPETIHMHFDAIGDASELRPRYQALFLPLAALGVTAVNLMGAMVCFRFEKLVARLLQAASVVVQILFAVAVLMIVRA
jgi:hypothetical protein